MRSIKNYQSQISKRVKSELAVRLTIEEPYLIFTVHSSDNKVVYSDRIYLSEYLDSVITIYESSVIEGLTLIAYKENFKSVYNQLGSNESYEHNLVRLYISNDYDIVAYHYSTRYYDINSEKLPEGYLLIPEGSSSAKEEFFAICLPAKDLFVKWFTKRKYISSKIDITNILEMLEVQADLNTYLLKLIIDNTDKLELPEELSNLMREYSDATTMNNKPLSGIYKTLDYKRKLKDLIQEYRSNK